LLLVMHNDLLPAPKASIHDLFLVCMDAKSIFDFVQRHGVAAVIHGHKHMPYVRKIGSLHVISLGSALYDACGPCAANVRSPSVAGLELGDGTVRVVIHPDRRVRKECSASLRRGNGPVLATSRIREKPAGPGRSHAALRYS
jgi:hypothetical protein